MYISSWYVDIYPTYYAHLSTIQDGNFSDRSAVVSAVSACSTSTKPSLMRGDTLGLRPQGVRTCFADLTAVALEGQV